MLTWLSTIPAGGVQRLIYGAAIVSGPPAGSVITNTALVADRTGGVTETLPVTVTVGEGVDWSASRQVVNSPNATPGQRLDYRVTISNTGNVSATGVVVTDTLDPNVTLVAASPGGVASDHLVTWSGLTVDVGSQVALTAAVTVNTPLNDGTPVENRVRVAGGNVAPFDLPTDGATTLVYNPPQAGFSGAPRTGAAPLTVTFGDESAHAADYFWDYGDGSTSTVAATHTHTYSAAGVYTVSLRVSNPVGSDVLTRSHYITTHVLLEADFSAYPTDGVLPLVVWFTDQSSGATSYLWEYGDGITSSAATSVHTHTYEAAGVFTVSLTVANSYTQDQTIRPGLITVYTSPLPSVYYVDAVHGDDLLGDGTQGSPWQTISYALGRVQDEGSEIRVAPGVHDGALGESFPLVMNSGVSLSGAGYSSTVLSGDGVNPVVLFSRGQVYSDTTSLSGFEIGDGSSGVTVEGRGDDYPAPTIENNWITRNDNGVLIALEGYQREFSLIRDNLISGNGYGIFGRAEEPRAYSFAHIQGNWIVGNDLDGFYCSARAGTPNIAYCFARFVGNRIAENGRDGLRCKTGYKGRCNLELFHNVIANNQGWGLYRVRESNPEVPSVPLLVNNLIYGNGSGGASFDTDYASYADEPTLVNNTIVDNNGYGVIQGIPTIVNCIIWGHLDDLDAPVSQVSYSDVGEAGYGGFNHNISAEPQFVNPSAADYHLAATSPAIDAGNNSQPGLPAFDIDGDLRIIGLAVDMGADESRQFTIYLPTIKRDHEDGQIVEAPGRPSRWDWRSRRRLT